MENTIQYFVTGAVGFIGKRLVKKILARKGSTVYFLIRKQGAGKVGALRAYRGASAARVVPVHGDLTASKLRVSAEDVKKLKGQVNHLYHLAAVYDLGADVESQISVNVDAISVNLTKHPKKYCSRQRFLFARPPKRRCGGLAAKGIIGKSARGAGTQGTGS